MYVAFQTGEWFPDTLRRNNILPHSFIQTVYTIFLARKNAKNEQTNYFKIF
jgi:hypothetical protein